MKIFKLVKKKQINFLVSCKVYYPYLMQKSLGKLFGLLKRRIAKINTFYNETVKLAFDT